MRTTTKDVEGMFARCVTAATRAGIDTARWTLQEGSTTYGRAWRLYVRDEATGGLSDVFGSDGYLGSTRSEAYAVLHGMARAFELVTR